MHLYTTAPLHLCTSAHLHTCTPAHLHTFTSTPQPTWLFCGTNDGVVSLWDVGTPSLPTYDGVNPSMLLKVNSGITLDHDSIGTSGPMFSNRLAPCLRQSDYPPPSSSLTTETSTTSPGQVRP